VFRVEGLMFRVSGLGFRVQGAGCRVEGFSHVAGDASGRVADLVRGEVQLRHVLVELVPRRARI